MRERMVGDSSGLPYSKWHKAGMYDLGLAMALSARTTPRICFAVMRLARPASRAFMRTVDLDDAHALAMRRMRAAPSAVPYCILVHADGGEAALMLDKRTITIFYLKDAKAEAHRWIAAGSQAGMLLYTRAVHGVRLGKLTSISVRDRARIRRYWSAMACYGEMGLIGQLILHLLLT